MKKQIVSTIVLAGMIMGSTDAFASRAREAVMGTGDAGLFLNGGSMYYDSMYNSFYNPAYINDFKNWAIIEKVGNGVDNQGGFAASMMNFNVGVFFNRTDAFDGVVTGIPANAGVRPIDLIIGGDMGVKWGFGLTHGSSNNFTGEKVSALTLRAGVSVADFDPYVNFRIMGKEEDGSTNPVTETKSKDMEVGLKYHYGEWTPYAAYRTGEVEVTGAAANPSATALLAGVARNTKLGEGARLVYSIAYAKVSTDDVAGGNGRRQMLPINLALEGDLSSWFTIRAGLEYRLMDRVGGEDATLVDGSSASGAIAGQTGSAQDRTSARIGASIHANKFDIDWAFGQAGGIDSGTFGFDNGTFTNVSLSYKW